MTEYVIDMNDKENKTIVIRDHLGNLMGTMFIYQDTQRIRVMGNVQLEVRDKGNRKPTINL